MSKVTVKEILNKVFNAGIAFERDDVETGKHLFVLPEEALVLLQAELDKCLPEKEDIGYWNVKYEDGAISWAELEKYNAKNRTIDDIRHRLREFINLEDKNGDSSHG